MVQLAKTPFYWNRTGVPVLDPLAAGRASPPTPNQPPRLTRRSCCASWFFCAGMILLLQFGILPPKVVPVARTKKILPRKERKELKKQEAARSFHTSATSLASLECYGGGATGTTSQAVPRATNQFAPRPSCLSALLESGNLSVRWRAEQAAKGVSNSSGATAFPIGWNGARRAAIGAASRSTQAPPLFAVLASHLSLLGPTACSRLGLQLDEEGGRIEGDR